MPSYEEDVPRLAEIARTLTDFRNEFRSALADTVRRDVYAANMQNIDQRIDFNTKGISRLNDEIAKDREDRKTIRNIVLGAVIVALISLAINVIKAVG